MVNDLVTIEFTATEAGDQASRPWHCLYFFPLPQGQGSLRPTFGIPPGAVAERDDAIAAATAPIAACAAAVSLPRSSETLPSSFGCV